MRELTQTSEIIAKVQELRKNVKNTTIIIDGKTLDSILNY